MSKFKVGDKVKCVWNDNSIFELNRVYTVSYATTSYVGIKEIGSGNPGWLVERFALVENGIQRAIKCLNSK